MVAIFGSIMPAPLAMPAMIAVPTRTETYFGYISVVMIASAANLRLFGFNSFLMPRSPARILSMGSGRPMTPVEKGSTS